MRSFLTCQKRLAYEVDQFKKFGDFALQLELVVDAIAERVAQFIKNINFAVLQEVIIFPDGLDHIPVLAVLLKNEAIRSAMAAGSLCVTTCPVIAPCIDRSKATRSLVSVFDPQLELGQGEQIVVSGSSLFDKKICVSTRLFTHGDMDALLEADVVHIAAHGLPISIYKEPWSSSLWSSDGTGPSFGWVQLYAAKMNASLYMLNMCHSADKSTQNSHESFIAGDGADYPSLLLLNGKSTILASAWRTLDTVSFVLTAAFIEELAKSNDSPAQIYSRVLAQLRTTPVPLVRKMLERIPEFAMRNKKKQNLDDERITQMFSSSYALGAHRCYRLLPKFD